MRNYKWYFNFTKELQVHQNCLILKDEQIPYILQIKRQQSANVDLQKITQEQVSQLPKGKSIKFISLYGIIDLKGSSYLVLITEASFIGQILFKKLFRIDQVEFVPIKNGSFKEDTIYLNMLKTTLENKSFYFSFEYNLTKNLQTNNKALLITPVDYNQDYFYNKVWLSQFIAKKYLKWITPVICGYIESNHFYIDNCECEMLIISRKDKSRAGVRYMTRKCFQFLRIRINLCYQHNAENYLKDVELLDCDYDLGTFQSVKDKHLYLSFRGTDLAHSAKHDLKEDIEILEKNCPEERLRKYQKVFDKNVHDTLEYNFDKIICTGHSLGGAVAEWMTKTRPLIKHCESFNPATSAIGGVHALENFKRKLEKEIPSDIRKKVLEKIGTGVGDSQKSKILSHHISKDLFSLGPYQGDQSDNIKYKYKDNPHTLNNFLELVD